MKNYIITILVLLSCFGVSAQNKQPSQDELKSICKSLRNDLNFVESKIDSIHLLQMEKLKELEDKDYNIDSLKQSNLEIYEGIKEILKIIPDVYAKDTTDNIALMQYNVLQESYNEYRSVIFNANTISIKDNFKEKINDVAKKLNEIKEKLKVDESNTEETSSISQVVVEEVLPLEKWIIIALITLLFIIDIVLIISNRKAKKKLDDDLMLDKRRIDDLNNKIEKLADNSKSKGEKKSTSNSLNNGQYELIKLKSELQKEISEVKKELLNIINTYSIPENHKESTTRTDYPEPKRSDDIQDSTAQPATKRLYGQLQTDGSFKTYDSDQNYAFYIIKLNSLSETIGEFYLKELTQETEKEAIDNRNSLLYPACEIKYDSANPKKIMMESMGIAEKRGNVWYVKEKAKISFVDD